MRPVSELTVVGYDSDGYDVRCIVQIQSVRQILKAIGGILLVQVDVEDDREPVLQALLGTKRPWLTFPGENETRLGTCPKMNRQRTGSIEKGLSCPSLTQKRLGKPSARESVIPV
jgi:hypothetical protein